MKNQNLGTAVIVVSSMTKLNNNVYSMYTCCLCLFYVVLICAMPLDDSISCLIVLYLFPFFSLILFVTFDVFQFPIIVH